MSLLYINYIVILYNYITYIIIIIIIITFTSYYMKRGKLLSHIYKTRVFALQKLYTSYILTVYIFDCKGPMKCVSLNNEPCKLGSMPVNINSYETLFYLFIVVIRAEGVDDPYVQVCVLNKVKNITLKVFNLTLEVNKTRV